MREGQFIKQNIDRWKSYETPTNDPDELAKRFVYLVDDLAFAKTFYPQSNTTRYINGIAATIYLSIYRNKKEKKNRFATFWALELPLIMKKYQRNLMFAFLFFTLFVAIGVFSAMQDQTFVRAVLGDGYVEMTEQNIANGNPFGVYKSENEILMFFTIALNNITVSFNAFAMGIFASVGTLYMLFKNALMVGVFEYMFFNHGLGLKSILVIFVHGTLELSAIVIAGCAGLVLGNSLLFPKTYTRMQSLSRAAKDAVKIVVGLVPVFIVAAFFESFVTRHTEMPVWLSLIILGTSLTFILWYFVFYPIKVSKRIVNEVRP
ncbi:MAG: stage II sporulation protein M [Sphingobacteriales bacterium]|nr:MAG: stage II sporulation protein M [Sphingobacteriales bacterium]